MAKFIENAKLKEEVGPQQFIKVSQWESRIIIENTDYIVHKVVRILPRVKNSKGKTTIPESKANILIIKVKNRTEAENILADINPILDKYRN
jgi:hypothetical protein